MCDNHYSTKSGIPERMNHYFIFSFQRLEESTQLADKNYAKLKVESDRLEVHARKACNWWIWIMLVIVCATFLWMVMFMKMFPKRWHMFLSLVSFVHTQMFQITIVIKPDWKWIVTRPDSETINLFQYFVTIINSMELGLSIIRYLQSDICYITTLIQKLW